MEIINQRIGTAWERISSAPIFQKVPFQSQNLVAYLRIIILVYCHLIMNSMPWRTYLLYLLILMLDISCEILASDHLQCKKFHLNINPSSDSRFGAILAQLIRQCAVLGLLMHLCEQFPGKRAFILQMIALMWVADFSSISIFKIAGKYSILSWTFMPMISSIEEAGNLPKIG